MVCGRSHLYCCSHPRARLYISFCQTPIADSAPCRSLLLLLCAVARVWCCALAFAGRACAACVCCHRPRPMCHAHMRCWCCGADLSFRSSAQNSILSRIQQRPRDRCGLHRHDMNLLLALARFPFSSPDECSSVWCAGAKQLPVLLNHGSLARATPAVRVTPVRPSSAGCGLCRHPRQRIVFGIICCF